NAKLNEFRGEQLSLLATIQKTDITIAEGLEVIRKKIDLTRDGLKKMDFWFRYLEPTVYKKINGPLPVEWETEVFEKFEKPYKREGAGLTLAALYIEEETVSKDSLLSLVQSSIDAAETYAADSITRNLKTHDHFYLCNRLFLLNLAAIYTTGFECPDTSRVIPELRDMMSDVAATYQSFNESFSATPLTDEYLSLYNKAIEFVDKQPDDYTRFDHFTFIRNYINPLFGLNQQAINQYKVISRSFVDYSLDKKTKSIFNKQLYRGQNSKGIYLRVMDDDVLAEIEKVGKLLFYDPIVSGNNKRSCASCHKTTEYFSDTATATSLQFNREDFLPRNTPSLVNVEYNHLVMLDGKHISLQNQTKDVISNPAELGSSENQILQKILSCPDYKKVFIKLLKYTPGESEVTLEHITSAITFFYSKFSKYYAPFDESINGIDQLSESAKNGFNLFMSKAQCATCHFVPQFNGVKPPFVGSEFEVLGVPSDTSYKKLSPDKGRYNVNRAYETMNAFRTGSLRNIEHTGPYMHNGVFKTMDEVIDFYDAGGGAGKGLLVINQTLSSDSLHLSKTEKNNLIEFLRSLNEKIPFEPEPNKLPLSKNKSLNGRKVGGEY
ncbi:MAG: cytochrome c peroxidase, partial [Chitinophagaceae bacterium]